MEDWKKVLENYISANLDDIEHEKKSVDFDTDSQTIFVSYRLKILTNCKRLLSNILQYVRINIIYKTL